VRGYLDAIASDYTILNSPNQIVTATGGTTVTLDFQAVRVDAGITGQVTDQGGTPLQGIRVWTGEVFSGTTPLEPRATGGVETDANGRYTLRVPAGRYGLIAGSPPDRGLFPPPPQVVTTTAGTTLTVNLGFTQPDSQIAGTASISGTPQPDTFVRAWPSAGQPGRYTTADASGRYTLSVTGGVTWSVEGVAEVAPLGTASGTVAYRSAPISQTVPASTTVTANLALLPARTLPASVAVTFDVTQLQTIVLSDGTQVIIPAGAFGSSGNATLQITPKSQLARSLSSTPVSLGYDLAAFDSSGEPITTFNSAVTVILRYQDGDLPAGATEASLVPQYWDPSTGAWIPVDNVVVNTTENTVTISVTHFTEFAVTASVTAEQPIDPDPSPTPTPTATATPTNTPVPPTATPTRTPSPTDTPAPSPTPSATVDPNATATPTASPSPTSAPATVTATAPPTSTSAPGRDPTSVRTSTPTVSPTRTPTGTRTTTATAVVATYRFWLPIVGRAGNGGW
jgi:hypothetical protein